MAKEPSRPVDTRSDFERDRDEDSWQQELIDRQIESAEHQNRLHLLARRQIRTSTLSIILAGAAVGGIVASELPRWKSDFTSTASVVLTIALGVLGLVTTASTYLLTERLASRVRPMDAQIADLQGRVSGYLHAVEDHVEPWLAHDDVSAAYSRRDDVEPWQAWIELHRYQRDRKLSGGNYWPESDPFR